MKHFSFLKFLFYSQTAGRDLKLKNLTRKKILNSESRSTAQMQKVFVRRKNGRRLTKTIFDDTLGSHIALIHLLHNIQMSIFLRADFAEIISGNLQAALLRGPKSGQRVLNPR